MVQRFGVDSPDRLAAVRASRLLERGPEEAFNRIVRLASVILATPMVALTVADQTRSALKGQPAPGVFGQPEGAYSRPIDEVGCHTVIDAGAEVCAADIELDPRLRDLPQLRELGVRSWLGHPVLDSDGYVLGNLCAADTAIREWTDTQRQSLHTLALAVNGEIALRAALRASEQHASRAAELAETLEQSLVPTQVPHQPGVDIGASFRPGGTCVQVLGDFYDIIPGDNDEFAAVIGDVSGHGPPAARATAMARSSMRTASHLQDDPVAVLRTVNDVMRTWFDGSPSFVTAIYTQLRPPPDPHTDSRWEVTLASAGHPPGYLLRADGAVDQLDGGGTVLGLLPGTGIGHQDLHLGPGDTLILHTDGITEARPPGSLDQFDDTGILTALSTLPTDTSAEHIAARITETALTHAQGTIDDDTGILVIQISAQ